MLEDDINFLLYNLKSPDTDSGVYLTICQFFIQCLSHERLVNKLINSQLFFTLSTISRFNNAEHFEGCVFYEYESRDSNHMLWLWTLELVNMSLHYMLIKKQHKILTYAIEFVKRFSKRIALILSYKFGALGSYVQKYSECSPS